jgi:hypothetical protein
MSYLPDSDKNHYNPLSTAKVGLGCCCLDFAAYAEPSDDVVAETSPDSLHRYLDSSAAPKLAKSTSLFDPGVRELSDLRSLAVNLLCRLGLHLGFEGCGNSGILVAWEMR